MSRPFINPLPLYIECEVGGKNYVDLVTEMDAREVRANDNALERMRSSIWRPGEREVVRFARVLVYQLGFYMDPTTEELYERILELGHSLCEPCDGPSLRINLPNQPIGDYFYLATEMDRTEVLTDKGCAFWLDTHKSDGVPTLGVCVMRPRELWAPGGEVVFRLGK